MSHRIKALSLALLGLAWQPAGLVAGETGTWTSVVTGKVLRYRVLGPEATDGAPMPLVFYLKNLAAPRVGTEDDASILAGFRESGHLVMELDFAGDPRSRVPFINRDLARLREDLQKERLLASYPIDRTRVFMVPSGCRIERDVVFFPDESRPLAMDIIHPSKPGKPTGAILQFSCDNEHRYGNGSLWICGDTILDAQATEGFAVAMADHPVAPPYKGLDPMPECAWRIKAAVRTLRAEGARLGGNGRIVPVGFSRGSGMALMLVTTEGMAAFEGRGAHPEASSEVQGAVVMSGRFSYLDLLPDDPMIPRYTRAWGGRSAQPGVWRRHGALDYLEEAGKPLFLTINCSEDPDALHQMTVLRKRLAELGNDEVFLMDREPRGHKVTLDPEILRAMDQYLKSCLE